MVPQYTIIGLQRKESDCHHQLFLRVTCLSEATPLHQRPVLSLLSLAKAVREGDRSRSYEVGVAEEQSLRESVSGQAVHNAGQGTATFLLAMALS